MDTYLHKLDLKQTIEFNSMFPHWKHAQKLWVAKSLVGSQVTGDTTTFVSVEIKIKGQSTRQKYSTLNKNC